MKKTVIPAFLAFLLGWSSSPAMPSASDQGLPKRWTSPDNFEKLSCEDRITWAKQYLGPHLGQIQYCAEKYGIPMRLLATVILNEMSDYGLEDLIQEQVFSRGSVGIVQMNVMRALKNGFLEDFITDQDLVEARKITWETPLGTVNPYSEIAREYVAWKKLNDPAIGIEIAAREINRILDALSANPRGAWAQWFLMDKLDRNDLYRNVKPAGAAGPAGAPLSGERLNRWIESLRSRGSLERFQEEALTVAVIAAYNTDTILTVNFNGGGNPLEHRWIWDNPPKEHAFYNARLHALNAIALWTDCLHPAGWPGGRVVPPPQPPPQQPPPALPPVKRDFGGLPAKDFMIEASEIGPGFRFYEDQGLYDNRATAGFVRWEPKKISVGVDIQKRRDEADRELFKKDYESKTGRRASDPKYVVESLGLGESSYIVKTGPAAYEAEAFPGRVWHVKVTGSSYSFSGDLSQVAPQVKTAVTNAIRTIVNRIIAREGR